MLIRVKYVDNRFDMVRPEILNQLLDSGDVLEFRRMDGWIAAGNKDLRRKNGGSYFGPERRKLRAAS
jgi:hypothetical protein